MLTQYTAENTSEIHKLLKLGGQAAEPVWIEHKAAGAENMELDLLDQPQGRIKSMFIYILIFIAAFAIFYAMINFSAITAQVGGWFIKPQAVQILGEQTPEFYQWLGKYFYAVNDEKLLDPNHDLDKDGLTNMDEFTLRTNPTVKDSDADGYPDGMEVIESYDPWGPGRMTADQISVAQNLDLITVNNRISFNASQNPGGLVSGTTVSNYDLDKSGQLIIPRLNLAVPLIWSKDPATFDTDLTQGVIHYPGTALPGELGTIYVSGHSSDYAWKQHPYRNVFAQLNFLSPGDDILVEVYGRDGQVYNYRYQVAGSNIFKPDDQGQFIDNSSYKLNLSTCWPIGTTAKRLVVSAVQVEL